MEINDTNSTTGNLKRIYPKKKKKVPTFDKLKSLLKSRK